MAGLVEPHGQVSAVTSKADADVGMETIELVPEIDGLSFSYDSRLGVFCGEALLTFADGRTAVGSYRGTAIPGWTNCGCGLENPPIRPFASGTLKFRDWMDGHAVVRSFPVDLDADVTRVTLASAASPASSGDTAGSAVGTVRFATVPLPSSRRPMTGLRSTDLTGPSMRLIRTAARSSARFSMSSPVRCRR